MVGKTGISKVSKSGDVGAIALRQRKAQNSSGVPIKIFVDQLSGFEHATSGYFHEGFT